MARAKRSKAEGAKKALLRWFMVIPSFIRETVSESKLLSAGEILLARLETGENVEI